MPARTHPTPSSRRLAAFLFALVLAAAGCGGARGVTLTELAANADYYDGRDVAASGIVVEFGDDDGPVRLHYVIQDGDMNRVELLPGDLVAPHVGSAVEVTGEFTFDETTGRVLHIDTIEAVTVTR